MKILITGSTYPPAMNGQSTFTANLAEGLARRGHEVWVVTGSDYGNPYELDHNGVHIWTVSAAEIKFFHNQAYASLFPGREANQVFHHFQPDILHLQDHYPLSHSMRLAARKRGIPVIGTNHFMPENLAPYVPLLPRLWPVFNALLWWWMKLVYNRVDIVTAPSHTAAKILESQGLRPPVYPVSCGVSLDRFHVDSNVDRAAIRRKYNLDDGRTIFQFVGRVDAEKKVDILIRAVKLLNRPDIQLAVTGNGAALHHYQDLVAELGVQDQVRFTGFVVDLDLPRLLNSIDIFSMPSEAELLSIASLEAMATGRPLLVARSKALPELVNQGENGCLFEPGSVEDAARNMAWLADHPECWAAMGAASQAKVQCHSLENVLLRYEELYAQCLGKSPQPT